MHPSPRIAFFGTPQIAVWVLDELERTGVVPSLIVTNPDAPKGRKLVMTPSPVALWAETRGIPTLKLETLRTDAVREELKNSGCDLYLVAAYGKLLPAQILDLPGHGVLNMHPSLLPKLRGASPIRSAILEDMNPTGVSIMKLTPGMDEGPILAQEEVRIEDDTWPMRGRELDELLAKRGGALLARLIPDWLSGKITPLEQDHSKATYSVKVTKDMGELDLSADPYQNLLKIRAFDGWPGTFYFAHKDGKRIRVKITDAVLEDGKLRITKVIPEGGREMDFEVWERS